MSARPPKAAAGRPPPMILPRQVRSGVTPIALLRAAARDAEAGHHLVEDQDSAPCLVQCGAQALEVAGRGNDEAHVAGDRLDDDGGDVARRRARARPPARSLYGDDERVARGALGHAGRARDAERRGAGAGGDEQAVGVAVVAAVELDDLVAAGEAAREAQRAHRRLGAGATRRAPSPSTGTRRGASRRTGPRSRSARRTSCRSPSPRRSRRGSRGCAWPRISGPQLPIRSMYVLPSASVIVAPSPCATNTRVPPTERHARTGELTPPGMTPRARSKID